jgi:hypothetical protein
MKTRYFLTTTLALLACTVLVSAQDYQVSQTGTFAPQNKKVLLLKEPTGQNNIILFQTNLRVNTDGSPLSYHPQDPRGKDNALNNICNAIVVKKGTSNNNLCFTSFGEAIGAFEEFRDSNFQTVPQGFRITWENVLPTVKENGKKIPCVFKTGDHKGYFGSLTALKNDLTGDMGECEVDNQVNPMTVPALVLVGGQNVVKNFGARVGDLLVAFNPRTQLISSAIIGDTGPKDNLGEGSVLLNMRLLGTTTPPTNKTETFKLSIENTQVLVAIIPASRLFQIAGNKPYTAENIESRVRAWQTKAGFATPEKFLDLMKSFQSKLN